LTTVIDFNWRRWKWWKRWRHQLLYLISVSIGQSIIEGLAVRCLQGDGVWRATLIPYNFNLLCKSSKDVICNIVEYLLILP